MTLEVREVMAEAQPLAVVAGWTPRAELADTIGSRLDKIYASLRSRRIGGLGHNVVVYRRAAVIEGVASLMIEVGVETPGRIPADAEVTASSTPAGRAALAVYFGPYQQIAAAGEAALAEIAARGLKTTGVSWEVYGDWEEDPAKLRTDLYWLLEPAT